MSRLGVEMLSVLGLDPISHVRLAGELGCSHISTGLTQLPFNPHGYAPWSLRDDPALRREMIAAMRDLGVVVSLAEGLIARPNVEMAQRAGDFDLFAELGAERVNTLSMEPDRSRALDQIAQCVDMAAARGMAATMEFAPPHPVGTLAGVIEVIRHVGKPNFRVLIDTMHLVRSGAGAAEIAALDPDQIGYAQLCDAPLSAPHPDYMREATFDRKPPGEGELPLLSILRALPRGLPLGLEVPMFSEAESGVGPRERLRRCVEGAQRLLAQL